jgi:hypothetical protein
MTTVAPLTPDMSWDEELLARQRTIRALDTAEAIADGVSLFVAVEDFPIGADDAVIAGVTRVSRDHWLVRDFPGRFEVAWEHLGNRPLCISDAESDDTDDTDAI